MQPPRCVIINTTTPNQRRTTTDFDGRYSLRLVNGKSKRVNSANSALQNADTDLLPYSPVLHDHKSHMQLELQICWPYWVQKTNHSFIRVDMTCLCGCGALINIGSNGSKHG